MLVVGIKPGEKVFIGENIEVVFLNEVRGFHRLGIKAPKEVKILREKLKNIPGKESVASNGETNI